MPNNSKARRAMKRAPALLQEVVAQLPGHPTLLSCTHGSACWFADLLVAGKQVRIVYDRGELAAYAATNLEGPCLCFAFEDSVPQFVKDLESHLLGSVGDS